MQDGLRLIVVVNGVKTPKERADDAKKLLEWGFRSFERRILFAEGQTIGEAKVFGGEKSSVPLVASGLVKIMVPKNTNERIVARIVYRGPVPAPVTAGARIGTLKVARPPGCTLSAASKPAFAIAPSARKCSVCQGSSNPWPT